VGGGGGGGGVGVGFGRSGPGWALPAAVGLGLAVGGTSVGGTDVAGTTPVLVAVAGTTPVLVAVAGTTPVLVAVAGTTPVLVAVATGTPTTRTLTRLELLPPASAVFEMLVLLGVFDFTRTWIVTEAGFTSRTVRVQLTVWPELQLPEPELALSTSRFASSESVSCT
jgi:hypothetical protein